MKSARLLGSSSIARTGRTWKTRQDRARHVADGKTGQAWVDDKQPSARCQQLQASGSLASAVINRQQLTGTAGGLIRRGSMNGPGSLGQALLPLACRAMAPPAATGTAAAQEGVRQQPG